MIDTDAAAGRVPAPDEAGTAGVGVCVPGGDAVRSLRWRYRGIEKSLAKYPPARALAAVPRTYGFAYRTLVRRRRPEAHPEGLPVTPLTPGLLASVALDEAILTMAFGPERFPRRPDYERVGAEVARAIELYGERGFLDDPAAYHRAPPVLEQVQSSSGWAHGQRYERLHFTSDYEPYEGEPGRQRWLGFHTNRTAGGWVLRHDDDRPRPWLVCIHGFAMGQAFMDFPAFHVAHLHHDLGLNLVGPTLPLHGPRRVGRMNGDQLLSYDLMNSVHGLAQAVWDIRRLLSWVRAQEPTHVGVYGISLGAYTASLLSALDGDLDAVIAGIPVSDFPTLFTSQSPAVIRDRSIEHGILGGPAAQVHRVVSPLAMPTLVPRPNRFIFAGLADRMSHPRQAHNLWNHWDRPRIEWYHGNHIGYLWSGAVTGFVDEVLTDRGLVARPEPADR